MKFTGTEAYVATDDLTMAVNAAVTLERPLLVKGEPGTGKTELARQVASALGMELIEWHVKSTTRAQQGLYEYDAVSRLRDSQLGEDRVHNVANYIKRGKLWQAFAAGGVNREGHGGLDLVEIKAVGPRPADPLQRSAKAFHHGQGGGAKSLRVQPLRQFCWRLPITQGAEDTAIWRQQRHQLLIGGGMQAQTEGFL